MKSPRPLKVMKFPDITQKGRTSHGFPKIVSSRVTFWTDRAASNEVTITFYRKLQLEIHLICWKLDLIIFVNINFVLIENFRIHAETLMNMTDRTLSAHMHMQLFFYCPSGFTCNIHASYVCRSMRVYLLTRTMHAFMCCMQVHA